MNQNMCDKSIAPEGLDDLVYRPSQKQTICVDTATIEELEAYKLMLFEELVEIEHTYSWIDTALMLKKAGITFQQLLKRKGLIKPNDEVK